MKFLSLSVLLLISFTLGANTKTKRLKKEVTYTLKAHELFVQKLDLLWIVDNSGSMGDEQDALKKHMINFFDNLAKNKNLNWKLGLISTDKEHPTYIGFSDAKYPDLNWKTPDKQDIFSKAINALGINGSYEETSFDNLVNTLSQHPQFLRKNADLHLVFFTDEADQSTVTVEQIKKFLLNIKPSKKIRMSGFFTSGSHTLCVPGDNWSFEGSSFDLVFQDFKHQVIDLCRPDFDQALKELADFSMDKFLKGYVKLSETPIISSIKVQLNGHPVPSGYEEIGYWFYDMVNNRIRFYDESFVGDMETDEVKIVFEVENQMI